MVDALQLPRNMAAPFSPTLLPKRSCEKLDAFTDCTKMPADPVVALLAM